MQVLPLKPGVINDRFKATLDDVTYGFEVVWNTRNEVFFLHVYEEDGKTAIFHGAAIVLGTHIGRVHRHPLLRRGAFIAVDTAARGDPTKMRDATFDDLGTRVLVVFATADDIVASARLEQAV